MNKVGFRLHLPIYLISTAFLRGHKKTKKKIKIHSCMKSTTKKSLFPQFQYEKTPFKDH